MSPNQLLRRLLSLRLVLNFTSCRSSRHKQAVQKNVHLFHDVPDISSNDGADNVEVSQVVETLVNSPGFGTRCMIGDPIP